MLRIEGLCKTFRKTKVLSGVNLEIRPGEVIGLFGRSGAGKSTLARCLVGLEKSDAGRVLLNGKVIEPGQGAALQQIQYLWQDPTQSLSPFLSARASVLETLNGFQIGEAKTRQDRAEALLESLGLCPQLWHRRPHALSGGECQRVALARALAAESQVLILDEPLSSLDLVTQISTINLLRKIHAERQTAMLIVSHDIAPLRGFASRLTILDHGQIVEDISHENFHEMAIHPLFK